MAIAILIFSEGFAWIDVELSNDDFHRFHRYICRKFHVQSFGGKPIQNWDMP